MLSYKAYCKNAETMSRLVDPEYADITPDTETSEKSTVAVLAR